MRNLKNEKVPENRHFFITENIEILKIKVFIKFFQKKEGFLKALANNLIVDVKILHI